MTLRLRLDRAFARTLFFLVVCAVAVPELSSESVTLTATWPAPSAVYTKIVATGTSYLATAGSGVIIGANASPTATLDVRGEAVANAADITNGVSASKSCTLTTSPATCAAGQYRTFSPGVLGVWDATLVSNATKFYCCSCTGTVAGFADCP